MGKQTQTDKPRIFISHAWEDKPLVRRLETELKTTGAEVWVDHSGIRGGDNLPERISEALEWCNTLLLIWSEAASNSRWVKLEWTNALSLEKVVIPCQLSVLSSFRLFWRTKLMLISAILITGSRNYFRL